MSTTVRQATFDLLRAEGVDRVFGNPGSTELPFLGSWPNDIQYVLGLQEATVVAMADGYAQATRRPAFVNLHSAIGVGHAAGSLFNAYRNGAPLVVTAGQQTRALLPHAPFLFAERPTEFPRPYVKWACEPARAADVPVALAHAFAIARTPPYGPTFVSVPVDDWAQPCASVARRTVHPHQQPDPAALDAMAASLAAAQRPALIMGPEVDRDGGWQAAVALAERLRAPVFSSPNSHRASFPEDHALFAGFVPAAPGPLADTLAPFDVIAVFGAPVFTFHVEGHCALFDEGGPAIFQVTTDPEMAAGAAAGTAVLGNVAAALAVLAAAVPASERPPPRTRGPAPELAPGGMPGVMKVERVLHLLSRAMPENAIVAEEAPSHRPAIQRHLPIRRPDSFFTMASGGLGYSLPAAVGLSMGAPGRPVVALMGDGSMMYSIQALYTAAQHRVPLVCVVLNNSGYGAMRAFSRVMKVTAVPGIELPGLDFPALAAGHGCRGVRVETEEAFMQAFSEAVTDGGPWVIDVAVDATVGELHVAVRH